MAEPLTLTAAGDPPPEEQNLVLDPGIAQVIPTPEVAEQRSFKAAYGMGKILGQSQNDILRSLMTGNEERLREEAAARADQQKSLIKNEYINNIAKAKGGPLSFEEMQHFLTTFKSLSEPSSAQSVFEEYYPKEYLAAVAQTGEIAPESYTKQMLQEFPRSYKQIVDNSSSLMNYIGFSQTHLEDVEARASQQSWFGWGVDMAKTLFPGYQEFKMRGNVPGESSFQGLLGTQLEEEAKALLRLPFPEFKVQLKEITDRLEKDNPGLAVMFARAVVGQSAGEKFMNNFFTTIDVAGLAGGAKGLAKLGRAGFLKAQTEVAMKQMVKSYVENPASKVQVLEASGNTAEAAIQQASENVLKTMKTGEGATKSAMDELPSLFKPMLTDIEKGQGTLSREALTRIQTAYNTIQDKLYNVITNMVRIGRIPEVLASENAVRAVREGTADLYFGAKNSLLDIGSAKDVVHNRLGNTLYIPMYLGERKGELFRNIDEANNSAKFWGLTPGQYTVENVRANGFAVRVVKPIRETDDVVRDALIQTAYTKTPDSLLNSMVGWLRGPEETTSLAQREARKLATYGPSVLAKLHQETTKAIRDLGRWTFPGTERRQRWLDWKRAIEHADDYRDPQTGILGAFFKSPIELQDFYQKTFKRVAIDQEVEAYFAYTRAWEFERTLKQLGMFRDKTRLGGESHLFYTFDKSGQRVSSPGFDGVVVPKDQFPTGEHTILMVGREAGSEELIYAKGLKTSKAGKDIVDAVEKGQIKMVRILNPETRPLLNLNATIADSRIDFVFSPNIETKALSYTQLPKRSGRILEKDYDFSIKQARMREDIRGNPKHMWYEGDNFIMPIPIRAMGKDVVDKLNAVREFIAAGNDTAAEALFRKHMPGEFEWPEFRKLFDPKIVNGIENAPVLDKLEPFHLVPKGKLISQTPGGDTLKSRHPSFKDGTLGNVISRENAMRSTEEALDRFTLRDIGTKQNPIYKYEPAATIDPIATMNRSLSRITNSFFMDDYKIFSLEHWLQEYGPQGKDILRGDIKSIRSAPYWYFHNAGKEGIGFKLGADPTIVRQAEIAHFQIEQLLGTPSKTDTLMHSMAHTLADSIFEKYGPKGFFIDPLAILPRLKDPVRFVRAMTFHTRLGLFSIPQVIVQAQTFATIYGIAGFKYAAPGSKAAMLHQWSRINRNPEIIDYLDGLASKQLIPGTAKFKPGEYKEAFIAGENMGFFHVAGEQTVRDDLMSHKSFSTGFGQLLELGATPYREGDRAVRYGAWYTAYLERRAKIPNGKFTDRDWSAVLERADLLSVNMSRASNSVLHTGIWSIPTQFLSYQLRMSELVLGHRLTATERARLLAWNAGLYGIPTSLGITGLPLGDMLRQGAVENGYSVGENWIETAATEGIPSAILGYATGTHFNIGERYGTQGMEFLRDFLRSDKPTIELLGGAAYSTFKDGIAGLDGFKTMVMSTFSNDPDVFKVKVADFMDIAKGIASVNSAFRAIVALNTGEWLSKREGLLEEDVRPARAIFQAITGLQSQAAADIQLKSLSIKDQEALWKHAEDNFVKEWNRGFRAMRDNDYNQAHDYFTRGRIYLTVSKFPDERIAQAIKRAADGNETLINKINWDFYIKKAPKDAAIVRENAYVRQQGMTK